MQWKLKNVAILSMLVWSLVLLSCGGNQNAPEKAFEPNLEVTPDDSTTELPDDFVKFYDQFHADEAFQLEHITWPLRGLPDKADTSVVNQNDFYYLKEGWKMHHKLRDPEGIFDHYFAIVDPKLIIEKIEMNTTNLSMERRFAKMDGEWMMIYYIGMNPVKRGNRD
jgi:hypothetical protein